MSRRDQLSVIDSLAFDLELKTFFYLRIHDLKELSATNNRINRVISSKYFWKVIYERDFKTALPESDNVSPQHLYYIRSISSFLSIDRAKTMNNMLNVLHQANRIETPIHMTFSLGIWTIEFDRISGYTFLEDNHRLGIELAYTSNGWFRYRAYDGEQYCVYSSAEIVNQTLHIVESYESSVQRGMEIGVAYKWGEWILINDIGTIYIINNTDKRQALVLSPYESGFVFYATDKNPINSERVIIYPKKEIG